MNSVSLPRRTLSRSVLFTLFLSLALILTLGIVPAVSADTPEVERVRLVRSEGGISFQLHMSGFTPGDVVTVWWLINPGPGFPAMPGPDFSVLRAAGHIIGGSGKGNFAGHVSVGQPAMFGPGLQDPHNDEIILIARTHGPKDPARITEQLFTPEEDCDPTVCISYLIFP